MFRWILMLRKMFASPVAHKGSIRKTRRSRPTVKLGLECFEDRIVPSVTTPAPPLSAPVVTAATTLYNDAVKTVETAISTYQHLGDTIRARLEAALHHHGQTIRPFAGPLSPPPVNTFTWDPPNLTNLNASSSQNWLLNGNVQGAGGQIPGNSPTDIVQFDTSVTKLADMAAQRSIGIVTTVRLRRMCSRRWS